MKSNLLLTEYVITFVPVMVLAILWHELGHVIGARVAKIRLLAWGIGVRHPWFHIRFGNLAFYLAFPLNHGLAIRMIDRLTSHLAGQFILTASGPIASALGAAVGILILAIGYPSPTLITWIMFSALIAISSSIPCPYSIGRIRVFSDGFQCWALIRHGRNMPRQPTAINLAGAQCLYELMAQIKHPVGIDNMFLLRSMHELAFGRWHVDDGILNELDRIDQNGDRVNQSLATYLRACLMAMRRSDRTAEFIEIARRRFPNDLDVQFILDFVLTNYQHEKGDDVKQSIRQLEQRAVAAGNNHWQALIAFFKFEIQPISEWNTNQSEALLSEYDGYLHETAVAGTLAISASRLYELGMISDANNYFRRATAYVREIARSIADIRTRNSFIALAARPLSTTSFQTTQWYDLEETTPGQETEIE